MPLGVKNHPNQLCEGVRFELLHNVGTVSFHGPRTQSHLSSDFFAGLALY